MRTGTLGAYRIDHLTGSGGTGHVYAATLTEPACGLDTGATVALKILRPDIARNERRLERLRCGAQLGMLIRDENVVSILDFDQVVVDGEPVAFVVMEYFDGYWLLDLMQGSRPISEERCRHVARGICKALVAIHAARAVHGALAPSKVFITPDDVVKVSGLSAVRLEGVAPQPFEPGQLQGAPLYLAPEQFRGAHTDARTDLHALGLMLYELAVGSHPYRRDVFGATVRALTDGPPPRLRGLNPQLSAIFDEVVHTLLAKAPDDRFQSAGDVLVVLNDGEDSEWWRERMR